MLAAAGAAHIGARLDAAVVVAVVLITAMALIKALLDLVVADVALRARLRDLHLRWCIDRRKPEEEPLFRCGMVAFRSRPAQASGPLYVLDLTGRSQLGHREVLDPVRHRRFAEQSTDGHPSAMRHAQDQAVTSHPPLPEGSCERCGSELVWARIRYEPAPSTVASDPPTGTWSGADPVCRLSLAEPQHPCAAHRRAALLDQLPSAPSDRHADHLVA